MSDQEMIENRQTFRMENLRKTQLLRLAFIAGPLLMVASSFAYATGIGMSPTDKSGYAENILGGYAIVLFIPIYWELSRKLAESGKALASVTYVTGLLGPVASPLFPVTSVLLGGRVFAGKKDAYLDVGIIDSSGYIVCGSNVDWFGDVIA